jgi:ankyrin repeat protein
MNPQDPPNVPSSERIDILISQNGPEVADLRPDLAEETVAIEWLEENNFSPNIIKVPIQNTKEEIIISMNALHKAALQGAIPALLALLKIIPNINALNQSGFTALHLAAEHNQIQAIPILLDSGANIHAQARNDSRTPLHSAALRGHTSAVQLLLKHGADIRAKARGDLTPFNYAAMQVHEPVLALLFSHGAQADEAGTYGTTALHEAALHGRESAVRLLLEKGADVQHVDRDGRTALHRVAGGEHFGVARLLIEEGVGVDVVDKDGFTALCFAGREEMVRVLLEKGADVGVKGKWGKTVLHLRKDPGAICLLLESGVGVDVRAEDGSTPLHEAARGLWQEEAKQLLEKRADVNARKDNGATSLYEAVSFNPSTKGWLRENMVRLLLDYGADPFQSISDGGESALSIATTRRYHKLVALLTQRRSGIPLPIS